MRGYKHAVELLNTLQTNAALIAASRAAGTTVNAHAMDDMRGWWRQLGHRDSDLNSLGVVHVAGTKGKGLTCVFAERVLREYGQRHGFLVGLFTLPHLRTVRERIRIDGEPISEEKFARYFMEVYERLDPKPLYFRFLTLLSFHAFLQEGLTCAVYEVGVGGWHDSTNLVPAPAVTGVTALGIDHVTVLGHTIEEIAWNKAGIAKPGVGMWTVEQPPTAMALLQARARELGASAVHTVLANPGVELLTLGIPGAVQTQNALLAVELAGEWLAQHNVLSRDERAAISSGSLPSEFATGLTSACYEGRSQTIRDGNVTWFLDGGHTIESVDAGSAWFASVRNPSIPTVLVFNQQLRDPEPLLARIALAVPSVTHAYFTTNTTYRGGTFLPDLVLINTSADEVEQLVVQKRGQTAWAAADPAAATQVFLSIEGTVDAVRGLAARGPVQVFVTGSLHLVGGLLVVLDGRDTPSA